MKTLFSLVIFVGLSMAASTPAADIADEAVSSRLLLGAKFELFVTDVEASIDFYLALGFEVAHQKDYGYTTLRNGPVVIALSPVSGWLPLRWFGFLRYPPIGTEIVLYSNHLEATRARLEAAGYAPGDIKHQSWGDLDFRVTDYDGYFVRVSEGQAIPVDPSTSEAKR